MDKLTSIEMTKDMEELRMKEVKYTVEREFLGKVTPEEMIKRMIQTHRKNDMEKKAV